MNLLGKFLTTLVLLLIISLGAWFYLMKQGTTAVVQTAVTPTGDTTQMKVEVTKTDITQNGVSSLPVGFPSDIPVETGNITESYRTSYPSKGVVQYTVSYTSLKDRDTLWSSYFDYMSKAGYTIDKTGSSKSLGQITGGKTNDTLTVIISTHSGLTLVQITLLDRP